MSFEPEIWNIFSFNDHELVCDYCGQSCLPEKPICQMCQKHMDNIVFAICRKLLYNNLPDLETLKKMYQHHVNQHEEQEQEYLQITIKKTLDDFPFALREQTAHYHKSLISDGVWFAHLAAYQMISFVRDDSDLLPHELIQDEMYLLSRDWILKFLSMKGKLDQEIIDTVVNIYSIPEATIDARKVILDMILTLEKEGKLKIKRPKGRCLNCDIEIDSRDVYCDDCAEILSEENRAIISSKYLPPISQEKQKKSTRGMFVKK